MAVTLDMILLINGSGEKPRIGLGPHTTLVKLASGDWM